LVGGRKRKRKKKRRGKKRRSRPPKGRGDREGKKKKGGCRAGYPHVLLVSLSLSGGKNNRRKRKEGTNGSGKTTPEEGRRTQASLFLTLIRKEGTVDRICR